MANYYKKNMELLVQNNPVMKIMEPFLEQIEDCEENIIKQDSILYFKFEGNYYRLHSENKLEEADLLMREVNPLKDHLIVLFGMGNIALLRKLLTMTSPGTKIAVFEPNVYVFKYILAHEDLRELLSSNKFGFMFGDEVNANRSISVYLEQKWDNLVKNLMVISLPNYYLYSEFRLKSVRKVTDKIDKMLLNLGTCLEDMLDGFSNHYKNVDACLTSNGIAEIRDKYEGYPAIIVASGPSLDKNIDILKEAQGKALIITCDASYTACKTHGVKPDMIASIERYSPTFKFYYEGKQFDKDLVLVGPSLLWPETYKMFPGKKILMAKTSSGVEGWWSKHFDAIEFVNQGMSCANVAYSVAAEAGCSPIIMIGQDLAYTGEKIHSDLTHTKYEGENNYRTVGKIDEIFTEDIDGKMVRTNIYYELFRHFFEEQILKNERLVVDATQGGALIHGTKVMTLRDAIDSYCTKEIPFALQDLLSERKFDKNIAVNKYEEIIESARKTLKDLKKVQDMVVAHYDTLLKYKDFDFEQAKEEELYDIVVELQAANEIIHYVVEENRELVSYYQQIIKQTIIYVKMLGNELTPEHVKRNWELQANLMYMMDIATVATSTRFYELIDFMNEKIKAVKEGEENHE